MQLQFKQSGNVQDHRSLVYQKLFIKTHLSFYRVYIKKIIKIILRQNLT